MEINTKKTCSIALMSGKGGSGKTTLALSMASLLSSCSVKTLLVDCDISTNGATYFFEEEMAYHVNKIDTLHELIESQKGFEDIQLYPVNEFFDFMPSVTKIGEVWTVLTLTQETELYLKRLFDFISGNYDVVIYDCQAGYTQILETVIRMTDRNLMVLEADSISASAVRNLFLKLNRVWDNKRIYQVFNKATKEEAEIYSKVTSGTMFDNIGCILFDWTVRRAFSISKIPDMIHTSAKYGVQVCELCDALIKNPEITKKLDSYFKKKRIDELKSQVKRLDDSEADIKLRVSALESNKKPKRTIDSISSLIRFLSEIDLYQHYQIFLYFFTVITTVIMLSNLKTMKKTNTDFTEYIILMVSIFFMLIVMIYFTKRKNNNEIKKKISNLTDELTEIREKKEAVLSNIESIENDLKKNNG